MFKMFKYYLDFYYILNYNHLYINAAKIQVSGCDSDGAFKAKNSH